MNIGIISDIHADIDALSKALDLLCKLKVDKILCAGDLVEKGLFGEQVVTLLNEFCIPCVQGNHDENAVKHHELGCPSTHASLHSTTLSFLKDLPPTRLYIWEGQRILITHASPSKNDQSLFHHEKQGSFSKRFKKDIHRADVDIVLIGHTPTPLDAQWREIRIFNPGSVCQGRPRDSHTCAILTLPKKSFIVYDIATESVVEPMRILCQ